MEEEAALGTVVGYVSAVDNDNGDNSLIDYRITCELQHRNQCQMQFGGCLRAKHIYK